MYPPPVANSINQLDLISYLGPQAEGRRSGRDPLHHQHIPRQQKPLLRQRVHEFLDTGAPLNVGEQPLLPLLWELSGFHHQAPAAVS